MKKLLILLVSSLCFFGCSGDLPNGPSDLKIEYGSKITEETAPRFSWLQNDTVRGARQSGYQILVASSENLLTEKSADMWNSGMLDSDQSVFVEYDGEPLQAGKRYYWTVRVRNQNNEITRWGETVFFDMGFTDASLWKAKWIGANESASDIDSVRPRSILLRKEFNLSKNIKLAKAYVTGLGSYQFFLNGVKVSDDLLTPGWTDYPTRIMYQVYDVTDYLNKGVNATGIILGNMWYSSGLGWRGGTSYSNGPLMCLMQIEVEYSDGSRETLISDDGWKWNYSPIIENTLYHGESYDARLYIDGWNDKGLNDSEWDGVDVYENRSAILSAHTSPTIRITREIKPVTMKKLDNGSWVFDMGLNMTGSIRLTVEGVSGTEIVMKFAELLHEDGSVAQENLRSAKATDRYILSGKGTEIWEPQFTYHGFRYVEISGLPEDPDDSTVLGLNFHNAADETGSFSCSNELLNKIQANILNGQRSNMFSVPTDCPQRDERLGWMGDAQIFAATSCYNMDMSGFYAKWIRDISDSQDPEGWVTDVNPAIVVTGPAKPAWGDAYTIVPWEMYRFYGDARILEKYYDGYKAWVEYMRNNTQSDGLYIFDSNGWGGYADWIAVVKSPAQPISAAYYYFSTKLLAKFAEILGYSDDVSEYNLLAEEISKAFQKRYFDEKSANYEGGTQTALLLPINFGLTPEEKVNDVATNLMKDVVSKGNHPTTGFLGTKYLLPTLSDFGYHDVAFKTAINENYPSWGYMVVNGATSMWELWNSDTEKPEGMNSRNHFALGSIGEWFYSHLAGIRLDENNPGFRHSIIAPMPADGLDWVKGEIGTPFGKLFSSWTKESGRFTMNVVIPPNTTATIKVPLFEGEKMELYESGTLLVKNNKVEGNTEGTSNIKIIESAILIEVVSGKYKFELIH